MELNMEKNHPENFILLGDIRAQTDHAYSIVSREKARYPEKFEGNMDCFEFELRYVVPFDKDFHELKRLQGTAAEAAGRRDEFRGYIMIHLSEWLTHHEEAYFNIALLFLTDMSDCWKYIFLIDNQNERASKEMVRKLLTVFLENHIVCKVEQYRAESSTKSMVNSVCRDLGVYCTATVKELLEELLTNGMEKNILSALLSEIAWYCDRTVSMSSFLDFVAGEGSSIRYMLPQKEYDRLIDIIEQKREEWYGEKEII